MARKGLLQRALRRTEECGALLVLLWLTTWQAAPAAMPSYKIDVWQTDEGLPQSTVTSIVQTRDGYLWLGTQNGLVRFDGVHFKVFKEYNTPAIKNNRMAQLFEDRQGALWISGEQGELLCLRNGNFQVDLAASRSGGVWVAANRRLRKFESGRWVADYGPYAWGNSLIYDLYEDRYTFGTGDQTWKWALNNTNYFGSYAYDEWLYSGNYSQTVIVRQDWKYNPTSVSSSAQTPLFCDSVWVDGWPNETEGPSQDLYNGSTTTFMGRMTLARHGGTPPQCAPRNITSPANLRGKVAVAFYDGYTSLVNLRDLWAVNWHRNWVAPAAIPNPAP